MQLSLRISQPLVASFWIDCSQVGTLLGPICSGRPLSSISGRSWNQISCTLYALHASQPGPNPVQPELWSWPILYEFCDQSILALSKRYTVPLGWVLLRFQVFCCFLGMSLFQKVSSGYANGSSAAYELSGFFQCFNHQTHKLRSFSLWHMPSTVNFEMRLRYG